MREDQMDFSDALHKLMEKKKISAAALAASMGLSSKTSIFRVLHNTASVDYQTDFLSRLLSTDAMHLTGEEKERLNDALEVSSLGMEKYLSYRAIGRIIQADRSIDEPARLVEYCADGTEREEPLHDFMERMLDENDETEIYMTGWGHGTLMNEIRGVLLRGTRGRVSIEHYLCCTGRRFVEAMASIMPVIYLRCYHPYCLKDDTLPLELRAFIANSSALMRVRKDGRERYVHIHALDHGRCEMICYDDPRGFSFHLGALRGAGLSTNHNLNQYYITVTRNRIIKKNEYLHRTVAISSANLQYYQPTR